MVTTIPKFESCPVLSSPSPDWKKLNIEFDDILDPHKPVDNESIIKVCLQIPNP